MAKNDFTHSDKSPKPKAHFQPFSWHLDADYDPAHAMETLAHDVGQGVAMILEIIERSDLDEDAEVTPLLDNNQRGRLMRLAISSLEMLGRDAARRIEFKNDRALAKRSIKRAASAKPETANA